jgi:phosphoribosylformylglycinamidine (FGAM) synthase-like enzyme
MGADLTLSDDLLEPAQLAFAESPSRYVLEVRPEDLQRVRTVMRDFGGIRVTPLGKLSDTGRLNWPHADLTIPVADLAQAWLNPLDW